MKEKNNQIQEGENNIQLLVRIIEDQKKELRHKFTSSNDDLRNENDVKVLKNKFEKLKQSLKSN
jgi:hypothetical protein